MAATVSSSLGVSLDARQSQSASTIKAIYAGVEQFDFHQVIYLLQELLGDSAESLKVGINPEKELFRFIESIGFEFPVAPIESIQDKDGKVEIQTNFMSFVGQAGILPNYYAEIIHHRVHVKDTAFKDFLDIFYHRLLTLYHQAWRKSRLYLTKPSQSSFNLTDVLRSYLGWETNNILSGLKQDDDSLLYYAGLLMQKPNSSQALQQVLSGYFARPIKVQSFVGRWLTLPKDERSSLSSKRSRKQYFNRLGVDATLGQKVWKIDSKIVLHIDNLSYEAFFRFLPCGDLLPLLQRILNYYLSLVVDYDIELIVNTETIPKMALTTHHKTKIQNKSSAHRQQRLGWNTWLHSDQKATIQSKVILSSNRRQQA